MRIEQLVSAESGWKAVFKEPDGSESLSRILGWAISDAGELSGLIVDPGEPSRIVPATGAASPGGGVFSRYRYVPPEPVTISPAAPAAAAAADPAPEDAAGQLAKSILKRRRS